MGPPSPIPALLTRTSKSQAQACLTSYGSSRSSFSTRTDGTANSLALTRSAVTCGQDWAAAITSCPLRANSMAVPSPRPEPAPVINIFLAMFMLLLATCALDCEMLSVRHWRYPDLARLGRQRHRWRLTVVRLSL